MLRCILICPNSTLRNAVLDGLHAAPDVELLRTLERYPQATEAGRLLDALQPQAILIDASTPPEMRETVRRLEALAPGAALIGVDWTVTSDSLLDAMQAGLRDFIAAPFTRARLEDALDRAADGGLARRPADHLTNSLLTFLPAKPGAGASTLATNTAIAFAARRPSSTLLLDLDDANGVMALSLRLPAATVSAESEPNAEALWRSRIQPYGSLDVLPAEACATPGLTRQRQRRQCLRLARKNYGTTVADVGGEFDDDTLAVLRESRMVFLVTTPELACLRLAHERLVQLTLENLGQRVELVVNRAGAIPREEIEDLLGFPVYFQFSNHYRAVNLALEQGLAVGAMAAQFERFAALISGDPVSAAGRWSPEGNSASRLKNTVARALGWPEV